MPEAKTVKNRMHIDAFGAAAELVAAGAKLVRVLRLRAEGDITGSLNVRLDTSGARKEVTVLRVRT